jgi:hypothetical protein
MIIWLVAAAASARRPPAVPTSELWAVERQCRHLGIIV